MRLSKILAWGFLITLTLFVSGVFLTAIVVSMGWMPILGVLGLLGIGILTNYCLHVVSRP